MGSANHESVLCIRFIATILFLPTVSEIDMHSADSGHDGHSHVTIATS